MGPQWSQGWYMKPMGQQEGSINCSHWSFRSASSVWQRIINGDMLTGIHFSISSANETADGGVRTQKGLTRWPLTFSLSTSLTHHPVMIDGYALTWRHQARERPRRCRHHNNPVDVPISVNWLIRVLTVRLTNRRPREPELPQRNPQ